MGRFQAFVGQSYSLQNVNADAEECVNQFVNVLASSGATTEATLDDIPGVQVAGAASGSESPGRGEFAENGRHFAVIGFTLYEFDSAGVRTSRGDVGLNTSPATFASNGDAGGQLAITSNDHLYILTLATNVLTTVLTSGATMVSFLNGYFLVLDAATSTVQVSDLEDGLTFDPANVFQNELTGDRWIALNVNHGLIWLFGTKTSQVWQPNGDGSGVPFEPIPGGVLQQGTAASFSVAQIGESLAWVSQNNEGARQVLWNAGGAINTEKISSLALDYRLSTYTSVSDCVAWVYQDVGHEFLVLEFGAANVTWVYDLATKLWHRRGLWRADLDDYDAYRLRFHVFAFDKHLALDRLTGTLWEMRNDLYVDVDGAGLRRMRQCPHAVDTTNFVFYPGFRLLVETGVGLQNGQGSNPKMTLEYSDDSGHTFGTMVTTTIGAVGNYDWNAWWLACGRARGGRRVFRTTYSEPTPCRILGADLPNVDVGVN